MDFQWINNENGKPEEISDKKINKRSVKRSVRKKQIWNENQKNIRKHYFEEEDHKKITEKDWNKKPSFWISYLIDFFVLNESLMG